MKTAIEYVREAYGDLQKTYALATADGVHINYYDGKDAWKEYQKEILVTHPDIYWALCRHCGKALKRTDDSHSTGMGVYCELCADHLQGWNRR